MITVKTDKQIKILEEMIARAEDSLKKAPPGIVNVIKSRGRMQYYFKETASMPHGKYIPKDKIDLITALVQKEYDEKFLAEAAKQKSALLKAKEIGSERSVYRIYSALSAVYERSVDGRKVLIKPYLPTDEQFVQTWEDVQYKGLSTFEDAQKFTTERGEQVRSKSEKMIADKLFLMKLPYRYEYPLTIGKRNPVFPDFTILDIYERRAVIYEHFGMMQDEKYALNALNKIKDYQRAGLRLGADFIYTMESSDCPLDMRLFEKMLHERFSV